MERWWDVRPVQLYLWIARGAFRALPRRGLYLLIVCCYLALGVGFVRYGAHACRPVDALPLTQKHAGLAVTVWPILAVPCAVARTGNAAVHGLGWLAGY